MKQVLGTDGVRVKVVLVGDIGYIIGQMQLRRDVEKRPYPLRLQTVLMNCN